jgi:hypothetical protein
MCPFWVHSRLRIEAFAGMLLILTSGSLLGVSSSSRHLHLSEESASIRWEIRLLLTHLLEQGVSKSS